MKHKKHKAKYSDLKLPETKEESEAWFTDADDAEDEEEDDLNRIPGSY